LPPLPALGDKSAGQLQMFTVAAKIEANLLKLIVTMGIMPPVAANTKGEKPALSTSLIRSGLSPILKHREQ